jgi:hypothetical protein
MRFDHFTGKRMDSVADALPSHIDETCEAPLSVGRLDRRTVEHGPRTETFAEGTIDDLRALAERHTVRART